MSNDNLWERFCHYFQFHPEVGISLDVSRMRFDETFLRQMQTKVENAFSAMNELECGAIANPDENRMVGHYWLRTPQLAPSAEIGDEITRTKERLSKFAAAIHSGSIKTADGSKFSHLIVVGIGGSALGPQLVADCLGTKDDRMVVGFIDNTDPDGIQRVLRSFPLTKTLTIVISKSGGTVETRNGQLEASAAYARANIPFHSQAVAVTCEESKLYNVAKKDGWLDIFPMWDWVGGRTSLFSPVGLLPAALQGVDIESFLLGASQMDGVTRRVSDPRRNPAMMLALMWYAAGEGRGRRDMVVLPYKDRLVLFSKYLQQLVMESLGKERNLAGEIVNQGLAVYGNKGSTDQHAYVQQLRDGINNFFVTFIQVLEDYSSVSGLHNMPEQTEVAEHTLSGDYLTGFFLGTREALYANQRDSLTIAIDRLNAHRVGALIALFERAVGYYASLININAYHQPGVEAGKKAAEKVVHIHRALLRAMFEPSESPGFHTAVEYAAAIGEPHEAETVYKILEHLAANSNRGVEQRGERHPSTALFGVKKG